MFSGARGNQICYVYHVKNCGNGFEYVWENEICKKDSSRGKNRKKNSGEYMGCSEKIQS